MHQNQRVAIKPEMRLTPSAGLLLSLLALTTPAIAHHEIGSDHSRMLLSLGYRRFGKTCLGETVREALPGILKPTRTLHWGPLPRECLWHVSPQAQRDPIP